MPHFLGDTQWGNAITWETELSTHLALSSMLRTRVVDSGVGGSTSGESSWKTRPTGPVSVWSPRGRPGFCWGSLWGWSLTYFLSPWQVPIWDSISKHWHCWHLGSDISLFGSCPVLCRMFRNIPGFYPLDPRSGPLPSCNWNVCRRC